jgi:hypothetical protein
VKTNLRVCLVMLAAVCGSGTALAEDNSATVTNAVEPMVVYDMLLGYGWDNWSWAKTELSIELTGSARRPIKVVAGPWQALYLHHAPFSTTGFKQLGLLIQGSAPEGDVRVFAVTDGKAIGEGRLIKLGNKGWTQVVMPLAELAAEDKIIDGIWVQNSSAADLPKFYVTDIKFE